MRNLIAKFSFVLSLLLVIACGNSDSIYEAEACERAIVVAKELVEANHNNVFEMERMILKAKAMQSEYLLNGDTIAAKAFDKSFKEYVQANDSLLAKQLF